MATVASHLAKELQLEKPNTLELSLLILTVNEKENLEKLLPQLRDVLSALEIPYEILIVDGNSTDGTKEYAASVGCRTTSQEGHSYGDAFRQGLRESRGEYLLTLDADASHHPDLIYHLWAARESADLLIGSRFAPGGRAIMGRFRKVLSRILSFFYGRLLALPFRDLSSGFRLYRTAAIRELSALTGRDFDVLPEVLVRMYCDGRKIREIPFTYKPRGHGSSHVKLFRFGLSYLRTLRRMWLLRNSAFAAIMTPGPTTALFPFKGIGSAVATGSSRAELATSRAFWISVVAPAELSNLCLEP